MTKAYQLTCAVLIALLLFGCAAESIKRASPYDVGAEGGLSVKTILPSGRACGMLVAPRDCWFMKANEELKDFKVKQDIEIVRTVPLYYSDALRGYEVYYKDKKEQAAPCVDSKER